MSYMYTYTHTHTHTHTHTFSDTYTHTHTLALIPKGIRAGDLRWGCEGLDIMIWNLWGNYCVALNR